MATDQTTTKKRIEKFYQVEVTHRGPEGIIGRYQSNMTTVEIAAAAVEGAKEMLDEMNKDTEAAEQAAAE